LKLKYDKLLSNFAVNCKLRHYTKEGDEDAKLLEAGRAPLHLRLLLLHYLSSLSQLNLS